MLSTKVAFATCHSFKNVKITLLNVFDKLQYIPETFIESKRKFIFFDLKNGFSKFLKPFLTHFDIQTWENDTVRLLWRSQKKFWDLQSKIGSIRLFQMFWGLIWYHSRGHTTKIDFGKRSRLKKKAKTPAKWAFWNNRLHLLTKKLFFRYILVKNSLKMAKNRR